MDWAFEQGLKNRAILQLFIDNFTLGELNKVPKGFNNNIIWNIAHIVVVQQLLVYKLSGLPTMLSDAMIEMFSKGTKPERDIIQAEVDEIKGLLFITIEKTKADYDKKIFKTYQEYTVSTKSTLTNVDEAVGFNHFHEGIHLGYILALKKTL